MTIPLAPIERISKKSGVKRISAKAVKEIRNVVEDIGLEIARESSEMAKHAKRKTIVKEDIKIVSGK